MSNHLRRQENLAEKITLAIREVSLVRPGRLEPAGMRTSTNSTKLALSGSNCQMQQLCQFNIILITRLNGPLSLILQLNHDFALHNLGQLTNC